MKLVRFGPVRKEKPGVLLQDGTIVDVSAEFDDYNPAFFAEGGLARLSQMENLSVFPRVAGDVRLGPCVARPGKLIGVGLNYYDHTVEAGMVTPKEPVLFLKATSSLSGPNDPIRIPRNSVKTDWEVELNVLVGKTAKYIESPEAAQEYIAGYCLGNDVSEREFQLEKSGQWTIGKSCDSFHPLGPFLLSADELAPSTPVGLRLYVNDQLRQDEKTDKMIFDVSFLVYYISQYMTLEPGDIISTGTPHGVGLGMLPAPQYLKDGDVVTVWSDLLGSQEQRCIQDQ